MAREKKTPKTSSILTKISEKTYKLQYTTQTILYVLSFLVLRSAKVIIATEIRQLKKSTKTRISRTKTTISDYFILNLISRF
jgi:hypothetical protein